MRKRSSTKIVTTLRQGNGIMATRSDLGLEIPIHEVPAVQKGLMAGSREKIIITGGSPRSRAGETNLMVVETL